MNVAWNDVCVLKDAVIQIVLRIEVNMYIKLFSCSSKCNDKFIHKMCNMHNINKQISGDHKL